MLVTSNLNIIKAICEHILNIYYKHIPLSATANFEEKQGNFASAHFAQKRSRRQKRLVD